MSWYLWHMRKTFNPHMHGSRKFSQRGSTFDSILVVELREDPNTTILKRTIISPPAKSHINGVSLAYRRWPKIESWLGSFVIFQGIRTSIAKKPYIFVIFHGRSGPLPPPPPPLWTRTCIRPYFNYPCCHIQKS